MPEDDQFSAGEAFKSRLSPREPATDEEEELWQGGYSPKAMIGSWIAAGLISVAALIGTAIFAPGNPLLWSVVVGVLVLIWVGLALRLAYRRMSVKYRLTNQRFFHQHGLLSRVTDRIEVIDMDDITFQQGLVERFVDVGSIHISSSDRSTPQLWLHGIDNVSQVADMLDRARRAERRKRGIHVEHI